MAGFYTQVLRFCNECLRRVVATLVEKGKFEQAEHRVTRLLERGLDQSFMVAVYNLVRSSQLPLATRRVLNTWGLVLWAIRRAKPHLVEHIVKKLSSFQTISTLGANASDQLPLTLYPRFPRMGNLAIVDVLATVDVLVKNKINVLQGHSLIRDTTTPGQRILVDCWRKCILDFSRDALACRDQLNTSTNNDDRAFLAAYDAHRRSIVLTMTRVLSGFPLPLISLCAAFDTTFDRHSKCVKE